MRQIRELFRTAMRPFAIAFTVSCSAGDSLTATRAFTTADVEVPALGVADRSDDPAVVAIDTKSGEAPCGGALVASDIVITALHCVAVMQAAVDCSKASSRLEFSIRPAGSIRILVGDDLGTALERARVRDIIAPSTATPCTADIALLLLDRSIDEVKPLTIRYRGASRGEHVRTVGFVRSVEEAAPTKLVRDHVSVADATSTEIEVIETAFDQGGGPVLDETTLQLLGVASRTGASHFRAVYTRADAFVALIEAALGASDSAGKTSRGSQKPKKGPLDIGANCLKGRECAAGVCVSAANGNEQYCSRLCGAHDRCPARFTCERTPHGDDVCVRR